MYLDASMLLWIVYSSVATGKKKKNYRSSRSLRGRARSGYFDASEADPLAGEQRAAGDVLVELHEPRERDPEHPRHRPARLPRFHAVRLGAVHREVRQRRRRRRRRHRHRHPAAGTGGGGRRYGHGHDDNKKKKDRRRGAQLLGWPCHRVCAAS